MQVWGPVLLLGGLVLVKVDLFPRLMERLVLEIQLERRVGGHGVEVVVWAVGHRRRRWVGHGTESRSRRDLL